MALQGLIGPLGPYRAIEGDIGSYRAIGAIGAIEGDIGPYRAIGGHRGLYRP